MYLRIKDVSMKYDNKEVLKNIDFELNEGELICVLGPSGCGKTTLLNIIGGFIPDYEGDIVLSNNNISNVPPEKRPISTVFQSYGLFSHKNVIENVSYGLKFLKLSKNEILEKSEDVLKKVGLEGYDKKRISELSGGELQRLSIARALCKNPDILLCDEPTGALDSMTGQTILKLMVKMARKYKKTVIIVTHNASIALCADSVIHLKDGKIESIEQNKKPLTVDEVKW